MSAIGRLSPTPTVTFLSLIARADGRKVRAMVSPSWGAAADSGEAEIGVGTLAGGVSTLWACGLATATGRGFGPAGEGCCVLDGWEWLAHAPMNISATRNPQRAPSFGALSQKCPRTFPDNSPAATAGGSVSREARRYRRRVPGGRGGRGKVGGTRKTMVISESDGRRTFRVYLPEA